MSNLVYIWDVLHQDYWLPDQSGHTPHKGEAGKYERTEAEKIEAKFYGRGTPQADRINLSISF